ncbi:MAG TPA: hypothetical protein VF302_03235 [Candidatus Limnocylindrales bacterium]|jgi:hypothetical protein
MAGYAGARPRSGGLAPRGREEAPVTRRGTIRSDRAVDLPRRGLRGASAVRSRRRQGRVGLLIVGIVVVFLLGLFSLTQTVSVSATEFDVDRLIAARQELEANERDMVADLSRLGREPAIRKLALDAGLGQLVDPLVVPAR